MLLRSSSNMNNMIGLENRLIRIPKRLRDEYNLSLGEFVKLDDNISLQVEEAFKTDINIFQDSRAFVTSDTLNRVGCDKLTLQYAEGVTLGCDPELFLVDSTNGQTINPSKFFKKYNAVGFDGMLCELRPLPGNNADQVAEKLGNMIKSVRVTLDNAGLQNVKTISRSSYGGLSAGFHCHMGLPKELLDSSLYNQAEIMKVIVRALDYYVGVISVISEGTSDSKRRCAPFVDYGKVSDHRVDNRTLEYRVPGGALLKSPELTTGLLELCSLVTRDAITRLKIYTKGFKAEHTKDALTMVKYIYPNIPNTEELCQLICVPNTAPALRHLDHTISNDLNLMFNYKKHSKNIDKMLSVINKDISDDTNINWELTND